MMASENQSRGKKRSKAFYRKSAYGSNKKHCSGGNVLEPGIQGFLVLCNHDEKSAVRESYNILNEYADNLYGPDKNAGLHQPHHDVIAPEDADNSEGDNDCDDVERALEKEVEGLKKAASAPEKRFQNVLTKAKNCVFIRTTLPDPVKVILSIMEDIAEKHLKRARYAARIIPIVGTCKANTKDIEKLACDVLTPMFSKDVENVPSSFTVLFKMRNNNGTNCGRDSVIPAVTNVIKDINPEIKFTWTDFSTAILVEVVCTVCCIGIAPSYTRLRKYNLQELTQGPKIPAVSVPSATNSNQLPEQNIDNVSKNVFIESNDNDDSRKTFDVSKDKNTANINNVKENEDMTNDDKNKKTVMEAEGKGCDDDLSEEKEIDVEKTETNSTKCDDEVVSVECHS